METDSATSRPTAFTATSVRGDVVAGLVSSTIAIPLAMAFGMFAFVTPRRRIFRLWRDGGAGLGGRSPAWSCVVLGDRSTRVYAPRITTTFFLGLLLFSLLHRDRGGGEPGVPATLLVFFAIILLGGVFQALFGLMRLGSLIKFAPHPVMAGFQNMAAVLLFLVQLGNVLGFDHNVRFTKRLRGDRRNAAAQPAGRRGDLCGDVERAPDHDTRAACAGRPRLRHTGLLRAGTGWAGRHAGTGHRPADGKCRDAHRAGRFLRAADGRAAGTVVVG